MRMTASLTIAAATLLAATPAWAQNTAASTTATNVAETNVAAANEVATSGTATNETIVVPTETNVTPETETTTAAPAEKKSFPWGVLGLIGLLTVQLLKANGCRELGFDPNLERVAVVEDALTRLPWLRSEMSA